MIFATVILMEFVLLIRIVKKENLLMNGVDFPANCLKLIPIVGKIVLAVLQIFIVKLKNILVIVLLYIITLFIVQQGFILIGINIPLEVVI